ncbi:MAG: DUF3253 domain-containing protein [Pseudomonadota bacterium]
MDEPTITEAIMALIDERGEGRTACPSEVARRLAPDDWRPLMPAIRAVAADLADRGWLVVSQGGQPIDRRHARGPVRLGLPVRG